MKVNSDFAVAIYCGLKILAATLVSRFYSSTYLWICLRRKIDPLHVSLRFSAPRYNTYCNIWGYISCCEFYAVGWCYQWWVSLCPEVS